MSRRSIASFLLLWILGAACRTNPDQAESSEHTSSSGRPEASNVPEGWIATEDYRLPEEHTRELAFFPPPEWIAVTPTRATRKALYRLPRVEGDSEDAWVVLDFFGSKGNGDAQASLSRWTAQFERPDSKPPDELEGLGMSAMSYYQDANGKQRRWCRTFFRIDISGTYLAAETIHGSLHRHPREGWRMLGATIEAGRSDASGPYYAELVGPAATVAHWAPSYGTFLESAKPTSELANPASTKLPFPP